MSSGVSPIVLDEMMTQTKWWTFAEIEEQFSISYDTVSRAFRGREGVAKFGSHYRVSDSAVRKWLAEVLTGGQQAGGRKAA